MSKFIQKFCFYVMICCILAAQNPGKITFGEEKAELNTVFQHVLEAKPRVEADLKYLSDDEREGRGPDSDGINQAAAYIQKTFDQAGLQRPVQDPDGFQEFTINQGSKPGDTQLLKFTFADGTTKTAQLKKDFEVCSFGATGDVKGQLVFAGYGISAPDKNFDELANIDFTGKIAVVFRKAPRHQSKNDLFTKDGNVDMDHASFTAKIKLLKERHAAGVLFLNDPASVAFSRTELEKEIKETKTKIDDPNTLKADREKLQNVLSGKEKLLAESGGDDLMAFGYGGNAREPAIPAVHLTNKFINEIFGKTIGKSTQELQTLIDQDLKPQSVVIPNMTVDLITSFKSQKTELKNVIGVLDGEGDLKEETIIVGAHYDHVGMGKFGSLTPGINQVHNGADDNASGTCALLEVVRNFGEHHKKLPRRIVFIAFSGEELGLLGSADYVAHPLFPLDKTIAMFNLDMVGRVADNKITIFGTGTSTRWDPLLTEMSKQHKLNFVRKPEGFGPSDHSSFYKQKIPVMHFFTGLHGDYHRPSDDWEKINSQGISRIACLLEDLILNTANNVEKPAYVDIPGRANVFNASGTTPFLGTIPELAYTGPGYKVENVTYDSPALQAGLKSGDIITKIESLPVVTLEDLPLVLSKLKPEQQVSIEILRGEQLQNLSVKLGRPR